MSSERTQTTQRVTLHAVVKNTAYRTDKFYRWIWTDGGYTTSISHALADQYLRELAGDKSSNSHKSKCVKALKRLFKWKEYEKGGDKWVPQITFSDSDTSQPRDFLTKNERSKIREAALEYGSIPAYNTVTPNERNEWKRYLSQRFGKRMDEITLQDWERANGWKLPSIVWASLDAGLRPIEVSRATIRWVDTENGVLRIPKDEASKSKDNWVIGLRDQTTAALERWLEERSYHPMYEDKSNLWLTRESNPYGSHSLNYILSKLCEIAGISTNNRDVSWYSIRHSVGTYMTREEDLAATQAQLRHKSTKTTMRYDQTPVEDRKKALERMG
jgi:integrase